MFKKCIKFSFLTVLDHVCLVGDHNIVLFILTSVSEKKLTACHEGMKCYFQAMEVC